MSRPNGVTSLSCRRFFQLGSVEKVSNMPTRYLKAGIRDSETIDRLSSAAEVLYYRLLVTVDDFGRYDARPAMLKAACFPIKESVTQKHIENLLSDLVKHQLVSVYYVDEKPYLQMQKWDNVPRAKESKFPTPTCKDVQVHTVVQQLHTDVPLTVTETVTKTKTDISQDKPAKRKQKVSMPDDFGISEKVALWAKENNFDRLNDHLDAFKRKAEMNGYRYVNWDLAFMEAIREDWAKLRGKPSFAQQAADVARTTVPPPPNQDAALKQIIADREKCAPPPAHIREMMKGILGVKNA